MQPISALLINEKIFDVMVKQSAKLGAFAHGYTYAGHPVTSAVALEVLKIYEEMDLVNHIASISPYFLEKLEEVREHPLVGDVRGIGLICGIELMRDGKKRTPFEKKLNVAGRFHENA